MFSIGEFSKICMVTPKTLRYYHTIGLMKPAILGKDNGYRYYEESQIERMMKIQRLKEYGFSLDEVQTLLDADEETLLKGLRAKAAEKVRVVEAYTNRLARMQRDIDRLEKGIGFMKDNFVDVQVMELAPMQVISLRERISMKEFDGLYGRLMQVMNSEGVDVKGYPMAIYHCAEFDPEDADVELCFETKANTAHCRTLSGGTAAMGVHFGGYDRLHETYGQIARWIDENGYKIAGAPFEKYKNSPHLVPEGELVTEIYFPIAKGEKA